MVELNEVPMISMTPVNQTECATQTDSVVRCGSLADRRKVLFFYQDFGQMGGIERYMFTMGQGFAQSGHIDPVFVCSAGSPLYHRLREHGFTVYGLQSPAFFKPSFLRTLDWGAWGQLRQIVRDERPDIVHVHFGLIETLLPRLWDVPVVFTFHGYGSLYAKSETFSGGKAWFKRIVAALFRFTSRQLDALLVVSEAERQRLLAQGFLSTSSKAQVMHNGIAQDEFQTPPADSQLKSLRDSLALAADRPVIAFINRLDENKNPADFVELARRFARSHPQVQFLLVGDGPLRSLLMEQAESLPSLKVVGYREDVPTLLALTDVLVYPSLREGFGLGLVEAMAAGVPCVAYASEGAAEILGTPQTERCLVPVGDLAALEARVQAWLRLQPAEKHSLQTALQERAQHFSVEATVQNLRAVYQHLTPSVSVILPVYNGAHCVLRAVQSVLNQSYPHWELLVVDDGSTDDTLAVLSTVSDARVRVVSQTNQGVAAARNHAFQLAGGDYIAFIDADDVWLPHKLSEAMKVIRRETRPQEPACLVYSSYYAVDERNRLLNLPGINTHQGDLREIALMDEGLFLPSTTLVHRSVVEAVGGFQTRCYHEDRVFFIQACQQFPAYPTGQRLVLYRQSESGRCRSILKDFSTALSAELSIVETLQDSLNARQLAALSLQQRRNLICRFLMYGYLPFARRLYQTLLSEKAQFADTNLWDACFQGRKSQLALLSLRSGFNALYIARTLVQSLTRWIPLSCLLPPSARPYLKERFSC
jgi:glycosyltransferase involved in cell wall biosynthesis